MSPLFNQLEKKRFVTKSCVIKLIFCFVAAFCAGAFTTMTLTKDEVSHAGEHNIAVKVLCMWCHPKHAVEPTPKCTCGLPQCTECNKGAIWQPK